MTLKPLFDWVWRAGAPGVGELLPLDLPLSALPEIRLDNRLA
jgi:hypothetical protein